MKKFYIAPALECLAFCADIPFTAEPKEEDNPLSYPWNDGELGWENWT